jgi:PKHD-type hydroxylase
MFRIIENLLTRGQVNHVLKLAEEARFADGRASNPHNKAKNNLQMDFSDPRFQETSRIMSEALTQHQVFIDSVFPHRMTPLMISRYKPGMNYGVHSDSAIIPVRPQPVRSDVSCTIFLAEPDSYEGGELVAHFGDGEVSVKGKPGSCVLYPSTTYHEVKPVTKGERIVAIAFIESQIKDPIKRDLIWELSEVIAEEGFNVSWENRTRLEYLRNNLRRMWDGE